MAAAGAERPGTRSAPVALTPHHHDHDLRTRGGAMSIDQRTAPAARTITLWLLRLTVAGALGVSAAIHVDLAATYDAVRSTSVSQGDLFRLEALAALIAAVAVL